MLSKQPAEGRLKWDLRFLRLCHEIATWSKDPGLKCGAVIVDKNRRIISTGYNGFATGLVDKGYEDREYKLSHVLHAEENAILFARQDLSLATIYSTPMFQCPHCTAQVIQSGISCVVCPDSVWPDRWKELMKLSTRLLREARIPFFFVNENENTIRKG